MEAILLALAAAGFAGVSSACVSWWALDGFGSVRSGSTRGMVEKDGRMAWLMRRGVRPFLPLAGVLERVPAVRKPLEDGMLLLRREGFTTSPKTLASIVWLLCMILVSVFGLVTQSALAGSLVTLCVVVIAAVWARSEVEKEAQAMLEQTPEIVRSMASCIAAGLSLEQTFEQLEKESQRELKQVFGRMTGVLKTGGTADQALEELKACKSVPELAFVAVALDVQHQTGGSLRQVLESARDMVEDELELQRSLRVQTAQAKLSARIVTIMPFFLVALFSLTTEGFLDPFFQSAQGFALLGLAVFMQVVGVLLVRRMLDAQE